MTAESDLEAYFGGLAATLGFHAGAWAAESPSGVIDALALSRKHDAAIAGAAQYSRLRVTIDHVEAFRVAVPAAWDVAALCYTPHRWPEHTLQWMHRCGDHTLDRSHTEACGRHGSLAGLVGLTTRVEAPTFHGRMRHVESRAASIVASTKRRLPKAEQHEQAEREAGRALAEYFAPFRREAEARVQAALEAYRVVCRERSRIDKTREVGELRRVFG